jgi:hypothetical protein
VTSCKNTQNKNKQPEDDLVSCVARRSLGKRMTGQHRSREEKGKNQGAISFKFDVTIFGILHLHSNEL